MADELYIAPATAPLRREIETRLRTAIVAGRFKPGDRLIEREMCELLGVSRASLREALRQLEAEELVKIVPHRGPVVSDVTVEEAEQLYDVRAMLEGLAADDLPSPHPMRTSLSFERHSKRLQMLCAAKVMCRCSPRKQRSTMSFSKGAATKLQAACLRSSIIRLVCFDRRQCPKRDALRTR